MDELVEFRTEEGARVLVSVDPRGGTGARPVGRGDRGPEQVARTFEASLAGVGAAASAALRVFRDGSLAPDSVEIEFGVKLTAETGAVIVRGGAEGHLLVRLSWAPRDTGAAAPDGPAAGPAAGPGT
ncbi:CU044_2847 family protein [Streptomyces sp. NPDC002454]